MVAVSGPCWGGARRMLAGGCLVVWFLATGVCARAPLSPGARYDDIIQSKHARSAPRLPVPAISPAVMAL